MLERPPVTERRFRVLAIASHPVQYATPVFRLLAQHARLDFHVAYCSLRGAETAYDPEFGANVKWDVPLLEGYPWTHVPNRGSGSESFLGLRTLAFGISSAKAALMRFYVMWAILGRAFGSRISRRKLSIRRFCLVRTALRWLPETAGPGRPR